MKRFKKNWNAALSVFMLLGLFSCSENKTTQEYLDSASLYAKSHQYNAAIVELKNAVKLAPSNSDVRLALANAYLSQGRYLSAEKEFEKALEHGAEFEQLSGSLAKVYSRLGYVKKTKELLEQGSMLSDSNYLTLLLYAGITALNYDEKEQAQDFFTQAFAFDEKLPQVKLAKAYYYYSTKEYVLGLVALKSIEQGDDFYIDAALIQGHLLFAQRNYKAAIEKFLTVREEVKFDSKITLFIINGLIENQEYDKAEIFVDEYLLSYEDSSPALFFKSKIEFVKENYEQAKIFAEKALQNDSELHVAKGIAGISAFHLEKYEQSYGYLKAVVPYLPKTNSMNSIFALLKSRLGHSDKDDELGTSVIDTQLIVDASAEFIKFGHLKEAEKILKEVSVIDENTTGQLMQIGFLKLSLADEDGFKYLEKAIEKDPSSQDVRKAAVMAYYKAGKIEDALEKAMQWQVDYPNNVQSYNIIAEIQLNSNDVAGAEGQLRKALLIDPKALYARIYFASKDIAENNLDEAYIKVSDILNDFPENINALNLSFKIAKQQNNTSKALKEVEAAYLKNMSNPEVKLFYAQILYLNKSYKKCIEILDSWDVTNVNPPRAYFVFLVGSYSNLGLYEESLQVNDLWVKKFPNDNVAWFSKLTTLDKLKDLSTALYTVEEMLETFPNIPRLKVLLPYYQILNKQYKSAKQTIKTVEINKENKAFIEGLYGKILFSEGNYKEALPKLMQDYNVNPDYRSAGFVYTSLLKLDKKVDAIAFMKIHLKAFPDDLVTKIFYGQSLLHIDLNQAQAVYRELIQETPDSVVVLNNLAWIEYSLNNLSKAQQYAEKANTLSPNQAIILDTLAMIYFKQGKIEQAEDMSDKALKLAPNEESIMQNYNLIRAN